MVCAIIQLQHTFPVSETAVSTMTRLGTWWPRNWDLILGRGRRICLLLNIHIGSGACQTCNKGGTRASFPRLKDTEACNWPPISIQCSGYKCTQLFLHSHICLDGRLLNHMDFNFTFAIYYCAYRYISHRRRCFIQEVTAIQMVKKFNLTLIYKNSPLHPVGTKQRSYFLCNDLTMTIFLSTPQLR